MGASTSISELAAAALDPVAFLEAAFLTDFGATSSMGDSNEVAIRLSRIRRRSITRIHRHICSITRIHRRSITRIHRHIYSITRIRRRSIIRIWIRIRRWLTLVNTLAGRRADPGPGHPAAVSLWDSGESPQQAPWAQPLPQQACGSRCPLQQ